MEIPPVLEEKFQALVQRYPVKRSALVPMALYAQDVFGFVSDDLILEIAKRLGLSSLHVNETLAYYSMIRRKPAGKYHVQVCTNVSCMLRGGNELYDFVQKKLEIGNKQTTADGMFSLEEVECIGACTGAPAMQVNYDFYENLTERSTDDLLDALDKGARPARSVPASGSVHERHPAEVSVISRLFGVPESHKLDVYLQRDGYKGLERALKEFTPEQVIEEVKKSNLRGRGGAGFPTGVKWSFVPKESAKPKYILCNADESEPGTCKDRPLMEMAPHQLIEGMVIAGRAVGAHHGYIYIRGEYRYVLEIPAVVGLYGSPTVINNVETLSAIPAILHRGSEWYSGLGSAKNGGTRLFCISGHVNRPGIYELPMGFNLKRMIEEVAGGIPGGRKLKAVIPGGSSCPLLNAEEIDLPMDFDSLAKAGSMLGSGGLIVIDESTCMVDLARRIMHFYAHESCGWCIPCREGTDWLRKMLDRFHSGGGRREDIALIGELSKNMLGRTFCPLGDAAALPTISIVKKWPHEFEEHLAGKCPYQPAELLTPALG